MEERCLIFPPCPEKPLPSDCCGNGCTPCVLDIYQEEVEMWEQECIRIKAGENSPMQLENKDGVVSELCRLQKDQYIEFTIASITSESHNTVRVRFSLHTSQCLDLYVGQHVIIRAPSSSGSPITRQYTPISPVDTKGYFEFVFKIYPSGHMSQIIKTWQVGSKVDMRGPMGHLTYRANKYRRVLMLCAGTGIAPMCQVVHAILDNEDDETLIKLAYACKDYSEILAKSELAEWSRYWNFSSVFVLSQEPQGGGSYRYGEEITVGHIDEAFVHSELGDHGDKTLVLICGTRSFDSDMLGYVKKCGVLENSVHKF